MTSRAPIGVFDSGVGGLSVLRDIRALLPNEDVIYVADTAYCPYGPKPVAVVTERSRHIARYLEQQGAKAIVVACNTATAAAVETLRGEMALPIVGVEPAVKPAASMTKTGVVGVLATESTLDAARFAGLIQRFAEGVEVLTQASPGLVELVESGELSGDRVEELIWRYVDPLLERHADVIVLGCTHYPFLRDAIQKAVGEAVTVLDSGAAVARRLAQVLQDAALATDEGSTSTVRFLTTAEPHSVEPVLSRLWGVAVNLQQTDLSLGARGALR